MLVRALERARVPNHDEDASELWGKLASHLEQGHSSQQTSVQDVVNALLLCETVYKVVDGGPVDAARALNELASQFGQLTSLTGLQFALPHVPQRFLLAQSKDALYVCFMGTKQLADIFVDVNLRQASLWDDKDVEGQSAVLAHKGFLSRAREVPVESLYLHACARQQRLVLCGHSLGGSVAMLCTLRLLRALTPCTAAPLISCIVFGSPAVGNNGLAKHVDDAGWAQHFSNFVLPEDVVPKMLVSARAAAYAQDRASAAAAAAAAAADSEVLTLSAATVQTTYLSRVAEWLPPGWTRFSGLKTGQSVSVQRRDSIPDSTAAFQGGRVLESLTVAEISNEHMSTADDPSTHEPQQASRFRWLGRRLELLQDASAQALSSLQRVLPSYPELAHFAQRTYLRALPQDATLAAASRAARDAARPEQRNGFLLAMHRMPAYRQRLYSLIEAVAPELLSQAPPQGTAASVTRIHAMPDLAPQLGPAQACARVPLIPSASPPAGACTSTSLSGVPQQHVKAAVVQSAGSRWVWPQPLGVSGRKVHVRMLVSVSGVGLSSVTHAWAQTKDGSVCPAKIIQRPLPPSLSPAVALDPGDAGPRGGAWNPPWSRRRDIIPNARPNLDLHLVVKLLLPAAQEVVIGSGLGEHGLQVFLQSDYSSIAVAVQLHPYHVWLLDEPDAELGAEPGAEPGAGPGIALMQHLHMLRRKGAHVMARQQWKTWLPFKGARLVGIRQYTGDSLAADVKETAQPSGVPISMGSGLRSLPFALMSQLREGLRYLMGTAVQASCKAEGLLPSTYSAGMLFTTVGAPHSADLPASCSPVEGVLRSQHGNQRGRSSCLVSKISEHVAALKQCARPDGWRHWRQLQQQQQPDVLVILLHSKEACVGRNHGKSSRVEAVRRLMQATTLLHIRLLVLVRTCDGHKLPPHVNWAAECAIDGHKPDVELFHSHSSSESEAAAIHFAVHNLLMRQAVQAQSGIALIRAKL